MRNEDDWDERERNEEFDRDYLLEQQEMEDFEQADEYFGSYNDWE